MLLRLFRVLGNAALRSALLSRGMARWMPSPIRFLGWKAFERQLLVYQVPSGSIALANDLSIARCVLADKEGNFPKSRHLEAILRPMIGKGLFGQPGGEAVRTRRKTCLKTLTRIPDTEVAQVAATLTRRYIADWEAAGSVVAVPREMSRLTIDVATTVVFGHCFSAAESLRFVDLFFQYHKRCNPAVIFCTEGGAEQEARFLENVQLATIGDEMREMVRQRFVIPLLDAAQKQQPLPPFVASLLEEVGDLPQEVVAQFLLDEISVMVLAGHETSASVLSWLLWEIAGDASLVQGLREAEPGSENHTKALDCLIKEGLRLYPPIAFYFRDVKDSVEFRGKQLPVGSSIVISPWTIHRHKDIWDKPTQFCPARWLGTAEKAEHAKLRFMPFGYGARFCPGMFFADAELKVVLSEVLLYYHIERVGERAPKPLDHLTARPDHDFRLRFSRRTGRR